LPGDAGLGAFLRTTDGNFAAIDVPGASSTLPRGSNKHGEIVIEAVVDGHTTAYLLSDGVFWNIEPPAAFAGAVVTFSYASGINKQQAIVGRYDTPALGARGYLLDGAGHSPSRYLSMCAGGPPRTVDASGKQSAPSYAFTTLTVPGSTATDAWDINNRGVIVGHSVSDGTTHGFVRSANGSHFTLDVPGAASRRPPRLTIVARSPGRVKQRTADNSKDDPHVRCLPDNPPRHWGLPHLNKTIHTPKLLVILYEVNAMYRQTFIDGRPHPVDPTPSWNGYSTAAWEGDTLVVRTTGFRDDLWIDMGGSPMSSAANMTERIRRPNYGTLEVEITVDDPKVYTRPWTVSMNQGIKLDTDLIDEFCLENEQSYKRMQAVPQTN
jgi:hypothetical protein